MPLPPIVEEDKMIHYSRVIQGILQYIQTEMAAKLAGSWKAWMLNVVAGMAAARAEALYGELTKHPVAIALGLVEGENINVDAIMQELRKQAQNSTATIQIPALGAYTVGIADVNALERYIKG